MRPCESRTSVRRARAGMQRRWRLDPCARDCEEPRESPPSDRELCNNSLEPAIPSGRPESGVNNSLTNRMNVRLPRFLLASRPAGSRAPPYTRPESAVPFSHCGLHSMVALGRGEPGAWGKGTGPSGGRCLARGRQEAHCGEPRRRSCSRSASPPGRPRPARRRASPSGRARLSCSTIWVRARSTPRA